MSRTICRPAIAIIISSIATLPHAVLAQRAVVRADSVLIAGDFDGSGRPDRVVRESRSMNGIAESRMAIYLDDTHAKGKPKWSSAWTADGLEASVTQSKALAKNAWLIQLDGAVGDESITSFFVITRGRVKEDVSFSSDHGQGIAEVRDDSGTLAIEASMERLSLQSKRVISRIRCSSPSQPAMRFRYDALHEQFIADRQFCKSVE